MTNVISGTLNLTSGTGDRAWNVGGIGSMVVIGIGAAGTQASIVDNQNDVPNATNVVVNSTGSFVQSMAGDALGGFLLNGGTVTVAGTVGNLEAEITALPSTVPSSVTILAGGSYGLARTAGGGATYTVLNVFPGAGTAAGNELTINGTLTTGTATQPVQKIGVGTLTLSGWVANSFTHPTTVLEGTLVLAKSAAANALSGALTVGLFGNAATARVGNNFNNLAAAEPVAVNASGTFDYGGSTAAQSVTTLDLRGGTVTAGTNTLNVGGTITAVPGSTTGTTVVGNSIGGTLAMTASLTVNTIDIGSVTGLSIPAVITQTAAANLTKGGAGTLTLNATAANTSTGTTTVNTGTPVLADTGGVAVPGVLVVGDSLGGQGVAKADVVRFGANNQINPAVPVTVNNSGLLDLNGFGNTLGAGQLVGLALIGGTVSTGATGTLTLAATVQGVASNTNITPATIGVDPGGSLNVGGNLNPGGVNRIIDVQGGGLAGFNPNVTLPNTNDMVIRVVIGNGGLNKPGTGKLPLTGADAYTGPTTINGGTVLVDGSLAAGSAVTVNPGGTLGGVGTVGGAAAVAAVAGGTVSPGSPTSAPGVLSVGSVDFSNGGTLAVQVSGAGVGGVIPNPGTNYDRLTVTGSTTLGGTSALTVDLNALTTSGSVPSIILGTAATGAFGTTNVLNNPNNFASGTTASPLAVSLGVTAAAAQLVVINQPTNTAAGSSIASPRRQ